jgi:outer membrane protein OmpA-like peptidoglycan-associated protein
LADPVQTTPESIATMQSPQSHFPTHRQAGQTRAATIIFIGVLGLSAAIFFAFTLPKIQDGKAAAGNPAPTAQVPPAGASLKPDPAHPAGVPDTPATTRPVIPGEPSQVLELLARGLVEGQAAAALEMLGADVVSPETLEKLQSLLGKDGYELDPSNAVSELGRQPNLQRWSLNLRKKGKPDEKAAIELDFARQPDGSWKPSRLRLPGEGGDPNGQVLANAEALDTALSFVRAVISQDFPVASKYVDHSRVNDATIAGLCILFEEGSFTLKKDRPLVATVARDTVSWFLAQVVSEQLQTESRFGLVLQRDAGKPWLITEVNLDRILSVYASRFGDGDVYFTPLVRNPQGGDSVVLYFAYNSAELHPRTKRQIEIVSSILKADPARKLKIWGHTDAIGTDDYNRGLSNARANTVRDTLIGFGVPPDQVSVEGFGATRPRRANFNPDGTDNPEGRRVNRRAEIYLDF